MSKDYFVGQSVFYPPTTNRNLIKAVRDLTNKYANQELVIEKIIENKPYNLARVFVRSSGEKLPFEFVLNPKLKEGLKQYADGGMMARGGKTKGRYNEGLSWHQDHARFNKSEKYEKPLKRRRKY
jgi:hypothetical protein